VLDIEENARRGPAPEARQSQISQATAVVLKWRCARAGVWGIDGMKSLSWFRSVAPHHRVAGYCCVLVAAAYVVAIALLVAYLLSDLLS
jgi:hypothetical protein